MNVNKYILGLFKIIDEHQFLSSSYDSAIVHWNTSGETLAKYLEHTSLLYRHAIDVFK